MQRDYPNPISPPVIPRVPVIPHVLEIFAKKPANPIERAPANPIKRAPAKCAKFSSTHESLHSRKMRKAQLNS